MPTIVVTLSLNAAGEVVTDPHPVVAAPGDTVEWTSDQGDVVVSFEDNPFENGNRFSGKKGTHSTAARIRPNAPRGHFNCSASIGGKKSNVYGIDIQP
jgi:hypothetical protein